MIRKTVSLQKSAAERVSGRSSITPKRSEHARMCYSDFKANNTTLNDSARQGENLIIIKDNHNFEENVPNLDISIVEQDPRATKYQTSTPFLDFNEEEKSKIFIDTCRFSKMDENDCKPVFLNFSCKYS